MNRLKYAVFAAGLAANINAPAWALASENSDETIVVTATGEPIPIAESGQSISVIDEQELARIQVVEISSALERAPGVTVTRNGGPGNFTGVRIRGSEAEQVLVLVDGVRVNDPSSPGGGYDFGNLLAGGVARVELLRGSNSVVWGSQAIGGVVSVETARGTDAISARGEVGARDTVYLSGDAVQSFGPVEFGLGGGYYRSDGFSSAAIGSEADGFEQTFVSGRASVEIAPKLTAEVRGRFADGRVELDGFPAPAFTFADTAEYQDTTEWSGYAGLRYAGAGLRLRGGYSIFDIDRTNFDPALGTAPIFFSEGRTERIEIKGDADIASGFGATFGAESEDSTYDTGATPGETGIDSVFGLLTYSRGAVSLAAGARHDDHQTFGGETTFGANGSLRLGGEWRVRASYGEGFKAPTLFQLLSDFGNPLLQPETSRSTDIGIEHGVRGGAFFAALTAFARDTRNQIDFVSCFGSADPICTSRPFGTYDNVARTRTRGFEAELGAQVSQHFRSSAIYSYIDSENRSASSGNFGNVLARRPKHALTVSVDWDSTGVVAIGQRRGLQIGADLRLVGDSFDNAANSVPLDGYALVTLRVGLPVSANVELYGRVENLFDAQYQTVATYGTPGASATGGVRVRF